MQDIGLTLRGQTQWNWRNGAWISCALIVPNCRVSDIHRARPPFRHSKRIGGLRCFGGHGGNRHAVCMTRAIPTVRARAALHFVGCCSSGVVGRLQFRTRL